jgi:hypothetical protein
LWRKADILEALGPWPALERTVEDFCVTARSGSYYLVTYRLINMAQEGHERQSTLRSSIWKQQGEGWQIVFHQGTPCL